MTSEQAANLMGPISQDAEVVFREIRESCMKEVLEKAGAAGVRVWAEVWAWIEQRTVVCGHDAPTVS